MTILWLLVSDARDGRDAVLRLGDYAILRQALTVGSSELCTVVLKSSDVAETHAEVVGFSNHKMVRALAPGVSVFGRELHTGQEERIDNHVFNIAHFACRFEETRDDSTRAASPNEVVHCGIPRQGLVAPKQKIPPSPLELWIERVRGATALSPDKETHALGTGVRAWAEERANAHAAALGMSPPMRTVIVRSRAELTSIFCREWLPAISQPSSSMAFQAVLRLDHQGKRIAEIARLLVGAKMHGQLIGGLSDIYGVNNQRGRWWYSIERVLAGNPAPAAPAMIAQRHAESLLVYGANTPSGEEMLSPWLPLWELYERGFYPVALPGGDMLLYLPLLRPVSSSGDATYIVEGEPGEFVPPPKAPMFTPVETDLAALRYAAPLLLCWSKDWQDCNVALPSTTTDDVTSESDEAAVTIRIGLQRPRVGKRITLGKSTSIGRDATNEIQIDSAELTERHLRIKYRDRDRGYFAGFAVRATNVFVHSRRDLEYPTPSKPRVETQDVSLKAVDFLTIGNIEIHFVVRPADMHKVEKSLLNAIDENPHDLENWAVYADWLEEHGRSHDAMLARISPLL